MAKRKDSERTRYEIVESEYQKFDKIFGKIEKLWIKDPAVRQNVNVEPLFDAYRVFQDLRRYFEPEHEEIVMKRIRDEEDQESGNA